MLFSIGGRVGFFDFEISHSSSLGGVGIDQQDNEDQVSAKKPGLEINCQTCFFLPECSAG